MFFIKIYNLNEQYRLVAMVVTIGIVFYEMIY